MKKNISNKSYINSEIPSIVLDRMAIYLRVLNQLQQEMKKLTSSKELSNYLPVEPGQIRKDLNYLGKFGINGKGYNVKNLKKTLAKLKKSKVQVIKITDSYLSPFEGVDASFFFIKGMGIVEIMDQNLWTKT